MHASNTAVFKKNTDIYFEYAVNYIHSNVFRAIRVAEITDVLGITQPYLYKIFINKCGQSPKRYIDDYRLKIAKNMLLSSEMSVGTIGNSVGFDDPLVFSRFFKKNLGVSPSKFRIINNTKKRFRNGLPIISKTSFIIHYSVILHRNRALKWLVSML